jgi:hypothetical protein
MPIQNNTNDKKKKLTNSTFGYEEKKKLKKIKSKLTNIPAFTKIWQETPILEKLVSVCNKFHVISIHARVKNFPISLWSKQLQLAKPRPSQLSYRRSSSLAERLHRYALFGFE